jgi:hypothetical protein
LQIFPPGRVIARCNVNCKLGAWASAMCYLRAVRV